ncbi:uncharacterized protein LOC113576437 [Electrophorus electricus]|uniref:uncharacterized protein LOC113576437 n=1 Tax=Electrophorus electricus TaxID=8005 RepID=UPI0015D06651|nr:uncharacterized protein LOC113576437 [Electrophorus electricus]
MLVNEKSCGFLYIPNGWYIYPNFDETLFGANIIAQCNIGYKLVGKNTRTCRDTGWDGRDPVCEVVKCSKPPKINNGHLDEPHEQKYLYAQVGSAFIFEILYRDCLVVDFFETGQNITLRPGVKGDLRMITWQHQGRKVVKYEILPWNNGTTEWYLLKNRALLNLATGDLTLLQLRSSDSGFYECEILVERSLMRSKYDITVMDAVSTPKVMCLSNGTEAEEITLQCSVDPSEQATFKWDGPHGFIGHGDRVQINKTTDRDSIYSCTAENDVSKKITFIDLKGCFSDPSEGSHVPII